MLYFSFCYEDNFRKPNNMIKLGKDNPTITTAENKTQINVTKAYVRIDNNDAYKWIFSSGAKKISTTENWIIITYKSKMTLPAAKHTLFSQITKGFVFHFFT